MAYVITITKVEPVTRMKQERELVKETPTELTQPKQYGGHGDERCYQREWQVVEKRYTDEEKVKVYEQTVAELDLASVIVAVNQITREA